MKLSDLFSVALISTGGTIEKTYDELEGILANGMPVLETMLSSLQLDGVSIHRVELMNKDSGEMTPEDHDVIAKRNTDALQNLVESFAVVQLLQPGVYVAMQNRVLQFPGVLKDTKQMCFVQTSEAT